MAFLPTGSILNGIKLEDIQNIINEQTNTQETKIQQLLDAQTNSINSSISSNSSGAVRHIQRGTFSGSVYLDGTGINTATVSLSGFSNLNKMVVNILGQGQQIYGSSNNRELYNSASAYVTSLSTSSVSFFIRGCGTRSGYTTTYTFSYEVVEFY